jgi:predicted ATP-binding protein involved in virulence
MIVDKLHLNQVRVFDSGVTFDLDDRMNLVIGVNGSGKSTTLDALRLLLTQIFSTVVPEYPHRAEDFEERDITIGRDFLTAEAAFKICGTPISYTRNLPREESVPDEEREGKVRHQTIQTKDAKEWTSMEPSGPSSSSETKEQIRDGDETPLAIYFSPERSVVVRREPQHGSEKGGMAAAYASALSSQKFNIKRFAAWMRVQERLMENESDQHGRRVEAVKQVIDRFLGRYENLRSVQGENSPSLRIDLDEKTLDIAQLSDGERGILSLVLDITTRLAQANPESSDPLDEKAVVLIDELELHLHPGWQREIVDRLTRTFPNCQFICTTHSPQVISEVENGTVFALERSGGHITAHEEEAYGLDTNWVLEHIMEVASRPDEIQHLINQAENSLAEKRYKEARDFIQTIKDRVRRESGEITRLKSKIETLELLSEDEESTQERE